nr:unnamed protein product [Callosobruchus chinensis]
MQKRRSHRKRGSRRYHQRDRPFGCFELWSMRWGCVGCI